MPSKAGRSLTCGTPYMTHLRKWPNQRPCHSRIARRNMVREDPLGMSHLPYSICCTMTHANPHSAKYQLYAWAGRKKISVEGNCQAHPCLIWHLNSNWLCRRVVGCFHLAPSHHYSDVTFNYACSALLETKRRHKSMLGWIVWLWAAICMPSSHRVIFTHAPSIRQTKQVRGVCPVFFKLAQPNIV
jgi:hypothetical protein